MKLEFYAKTTDDKNIEQIADTYNLTIFHKRNIIKGDKRSWTFSGTQENVYWFLWRMKGQYVLE